MSHYVLPVSVLRRMDVEVDCRVALRVEHGSTAELAVEPGQHSVQGRMDWHASPVLEVTVAEGGTTEVQVAYSFASITQLFRRTDDAIEIREL